MAQGTVQKIFEKNWDGPDGTVVLYSFALGGDKAYYRTGKKTPAAYGIVEGKSVSFDTDYKGNVVPKSVKILGDGVIQQAPSVPRGGSTQSVQVSGSRDTYWADKEARDIAKDERYQAVDIPRMTYCGAQDSAVKVVEMALANGGITLPTKKGAILDTIIGAVNEVALRLATLRMSAPELLGVGTAASGSGRADAEATTDEDTDAGYD